MMTQEYHGQDANGELRRKNSNAGFMILWQTSVRVARVAGIIKVAAEHGL
jgi:hypothetical protein